jgi:ribosomal protein S18 acetylase RimI-like enzyme
MASPAYIIVIVFCRQDDYSKNIEDLTMRRTLMDSLILANGWVVRRLYEDDRAAAAALCEKCGDYFYMLHSSGPSGQDIEEIFNELPPGKTTDDKFVLGIFDSANEMSGIVDIIRDYPSRGEWTLGLLLIAPDARRKGLGAAVHQALADQTARLGAKVLRLGVLEENKSAVDFWTRLGYKKQKLVDMCFQNQMHVVHVMTLNLDGTLTGV